MMTDPHFAVPVPVIEPSDAEKKAIAEMSSRFSPETTTANAARLHRQEVEASAKPPTAVSAIERQIAAERAVRDRAKEGQEILARLKALKLADD
jgi:hypothetical protein